MLPYRHPAALAAGAAGAQEMRKAFEKNVPRRRPRLRRAAAIEGLTPGVQGTTQPAALVAHPAAPFPPPQTPGETAGGHERLDGIERKMAELAAPAPRVELARIRRRVVRPAPFVSLLRGVPPRSPDASVAAPVEALRAELARARQREKALRGELHAARGELARTADEARGAAERLATAYAEYLLQAMARQRTRVAQASARGLPAGVPGGVSRGEAERDPLTSRAVGFVPRTGAGASRGR